MGGRGFAAEDQPDPAAGFIKGGRHGFGDGDGAFGGGAAQLELQPPPFVAGFADTPEFKRADFSQRRAQVDRDVAAGSAGFSRLWMSGTRRRLGRFGMA